MKKLLLILPLLIWISCEDSSKDDSSSIYGLWEWRYTYTGNWDELSPTDWWSDISAESYSERFLQNANSDSSCYTEWEIIKDSLGSAAVDWDIIGDDSAALTIYWDDPVTVTFKTHDDTLYWYWDGSEASAKAIRIESYDFTPICE